jgi:hypothetical protein
VGNPPLGAQKRPEGPGCCRRCRREEVRHQRPGSALVFPLTVAVLYYTSPNVELRGFRWVTAKTHDKTHCTLGGLIALLVWFWISNLAILSGHQLNAERGRSLELGEERPRPAREIQLEPREEPRPKRPPDGDGETMSPSSTDIPGKLKPLTEELLATTTPVTTCRKAPRGATTGYRCSQKRRVKPSQDRKMGS